MSFRHSNAGAPSAHLDYHGVCLRGLTVLSLPRVENMQGHAYPTEPTIRKSIRAADVTA